MRVSAEERRSLEGVYRWRSSERYCGPVPVTTLKQSVEILYCIHGLIRSQCSNRRMGWTWSGFLALQTSHAELQSEVSTICQ